MSREQPIAYNKPPLAGRPPFATDEPDSIYQTGPSAQVRYRQASPPDPNARTSAYNTYDLYLNDSSDQDERNPFKEPPQVSTNSSKSIPLAAPRPGYAASVAALNLVPPSPAATSESRRSPGSIPSPALFGVHTSPHPLQPPMTPITPVFIRPTNDSRQDVTFEMQKPILRGVQEETLLPKRGERGDDFWRRFSMVVKEEAKVQYKESNWLKKTQGHSTQLSRCVLIVGLVLIICIASACGIGWYLSHNNSSHTAPTAVGGKGIAVSVLASSSSGVAGGIAHGPASRHVSPTLTINYKREPLPSPGIALDYRAFSNRGQRRRRSHLGLSYMH